MFFSFMDQQHFKNIIVGGGLSGLTLAHKLATELNEEVLILEKKSHIGGNCYDYWDENGICLHQYGTHIFHTNNKEVWDFLSQFTRWYPYQHKVKALVEGQEIPLPFNLNSLHQLFPENIAERLEEKLVDFFGWGVKVPILELKKKEDPDLEFLAEYIYHHVFLHYTLKQWGKTPEELDAFVTSRVPILISKDDRYFQDTYQGIPLQGYTAMMEKMKDHPLIKIQLNTCYEDVKKQYSSDRLFYTGSIDEFFGYSLGVLSYRSIHLDFITFDYPYFQSCACLNYPNNYTWTRIGEYKYFLHNMSPKTVVSYEYPEAFVLGKNERYYPISSEENNALYEQYQKLAETHSPTLHFLGRLGDYQYYDMDKAIERALSLYEEIKTKA